MKRIFKDIVFVAIFLLLLGVCSNIFVLKGNGYGSDVWSFYELKRDSLDVVFLGSSHSYASFSPEVIEKNAGLKSYNFATQQQPLSITYYYMREVLKRHQPQTIVLEARMLTVDDAFMKEGVVRDALDKMPLSFNKLRAINASVEKPQDRVSYYLNIIKYHNRYDRLNKNDIASGILRNGIDNNGFKALESKLDIWNDNKEILKIEEKQEISDKNLFYLEKMVDLAEERGIRLIIVKSPCLLSAKERKNLNWVEQYATEREIEFIDYNERVEALGLIAGDYYDKGHLSATGAEKVSVDFAKYLIADQQ